MVNAHSVSAAFQPDVDLEDVLDNYETYIQYTSEFGHPKSYEILSSVPGSTSRGVARYINICLPSICRRR